MSGATDLIPAVNVAAMTAAQAQAEYDKFVADPNLAKLLMDGHPRATAHFQALGERMHGLDVSAPGPHYVPTDARNPAPATPIDAAKRLDVLMADKATDRTGRTWAQRVDHGDAAAFKQFQELVALKAQASDGDYAVAGFVPDDHLDAFREMPLRHVVETGRNLLERGHSPEAVKGIIDGQVPTDDQRRAGEMFIADVAAGRVQVSGAVAQLFDEACWAAGGP
jgi:hypothetical protein